jgi:hypothetical protein
VKWTIRIEVTLDGNGSSTHDVGTITRPIADLSPEQIGLTLEEGQQLLRRIQMAIIGNQVHGYELRRRLCNDCGRRQRIKDERRKCVQTAFGGFRLRGRRYRVCQCQPREIGPVFFPLGEIIPRQTTRAAGGFIDIFGEDGTLLKQLAQGAPLNQPWGLAVAPKNFGPVSNTLFVSNNLPNGTINAFNAITGQFVGTLKDADGKVTSTTPGELSSVAEPR